MSRLGNDEYKRPKKTLTDKLTKDEIQSKLEAAISILEPLIIIVLGGIVALVVIALMTTTMSLNLMVT